MIKLLWWEKLVTRLIDHVLAVSVFLLRAIGMERVRGPLPSPQSVRSILVLELWRMGDLILSTSVYESLAQRFPSASIVVLGGPLAPEVLAHCPFVHEVIPYAFPWTSDSGKYAFWRYPWQRIYALIKNLRLRDFDLSVDARGDLRNNVLSYLIGARCRVGFADTGGRCLLTQVATRPAGSGHRVDSWRGVLDAVGASSEGATPHLWTSSEEDLAVDQVLAQHGIDTSRPIVGFHPGARQPVRRWNSEGFLWVAQEIVARGIQVVVIVDPDGTSSTLASRLEPLGVPGLQLDLRRLMALAGRLSLLVCNDSGPMHMAVARGTPVVAIFGPMEPGWFGPRGSNHRVVYEPVMPCRPCSDQCRFPSPICLDSISRERVLSAVLQCCAEIGLLASDGQRA